MANIVHLEIPAPDMAKAKQFYGDVFKWSFSDMGPEYVMFKTGEGDGITGGGFDAKMEASDKGVNLYIQVEDIPGALKAIAKSGGSVLAEKTKISDEHGFYAIFKDPNGNRLGVWSLK